MIDMGVVGEGVMQFIRGVFAEGGNFWVSRGGHAIYEGCFPPKAEKFLGFEGGVMQFMRWVFAPEAPKIV